MRQSGRTAVGTRAEGPSALDDNDITTEIVTEDAGAGHRGRSTIVRLSWRQHDPLAVSITVVSQSEHPSLPRGHWVVLRDFLRYGIEEPTGDGDVRIRPAGSDVQLELLRTLRPCTVRVPAGWLADFLDLTERVVPSGEERSEDALDALIQRLLEQ